MSKFVLLLTGSGTYASLSPAEHEAALKLYMDWTSKLRADGYFLDAERLADETRLISPGVKPVVTDGPFAESKEAVAGFYAVEAKDLDAATELALGCPHLKYGGYMHVRPVFAMG